MNIQGAIKQYLITELLNDHKNLGIDDNLLIGGLVDSLGIMRLVSYIEQNFSIRVPPEDVTIENFRSIRVIAEYTENRMATVVTT
jgi:acyl carrier protein